ncbi:MAG: ATP-binding protein [Microthrixaceae bacterium]|nr:ATP-binding protein [Microthrixaceae bacterium]
MLSPTATSHHPGPPSDRAAATFPADRRSPGRARRFVLAQLREWRCEEAADVVALLVSELVTNGVLHAGTPVGVAVGIEGGQLVVAVSDGVPDGVDPGPAPAVPSRGAPSGRGLRIVAALADRWGASVHDTGKTVWFEVDLP